MGLFKKKKKPKYVEEILEFEEQGQPQEEEKSGIQILESRKNPGIQGKIQRWNIANRS